MSDDDLRRLFRTVGEPRGFHALRNRWTGAQRNYVAAFPGFFALQFSDKNELERLPVVAWMIDLNYRLDLEPIPVTMPPSGHFDCAEYSILLPDGRVWWTLDKDRLFASIDEWTKVVGQRWRCKDCGTRRLGPGLRDEVWLSIADSQDFLCTGCMENRLNRKLVAEDLYCPDLYTTEAGELRIYDE